MRFRIVRTFPSVDVPGWSLVDRALLRVYVFADWQSAVSAMDRALAGKPFLALTIGRITIDEALVGLSLEQARTFMRDYGSFDPPAPAGVVKGPKELQ